MPDETTNENIPSDAESTEQPGPESHEPEPSADVPTPSQEPANEPNDDAAAQPPSADLPGSDGGGEFDSEETGASGAKTAEDAEIDEPDNQAIDIISVPLTEFVHPYDRIRAEIIEHGGDCYKDHATNTLELFLPTGEFARCFYLEQVNVVNARRTTRQEWTRPVSTE